MERPHGPRDVCVFEGLIDRIWYFRVRSGGEVVDLYVWVLYGGIPRRLYGGKLTGIFFLWRYYAGFD